MAKKTKTEKKVDLRKVPRAERGAPTTGQSGPSLKLDRADLSKDEEKVVACLIHEGTALKIKELTKETRLTSLRIRNALRRIVRAGFVKNVARGEYQASGGGSRASKPTGGTIQTRSVPPAATKKAPKVKKEAKGIEVVDLEVLKTKVRASMPSLGEDSSMFKSALVALAGEAVGMSDSAIAKVTGLSRGFIIPRIKRLKKVSGPITPGTLEKFAQVAEG